MGAASHGVSYQSVSNREAVMSKQWQYQIRIDLPDELAEQARRNPNAGALQPLTQILRQHDAALVCQFDAFTAYVADAEKQGPEHFPLYKWTKATLEDPERCRRHKQAFALRLSGHEVYGRAIADAVEAALRPLAEAGLITRLSRHDTNPANNLRVPAEFR
jgi:hypothetical protein